MTDEEFAKIIHSNFENAFSHNSILFRTSITNLLNELFQSTFYNSTIYQSMAWSVIHNKIFEHIESCCKEICSKESVIKTLNDIEKPNYQYFFENLKKSCEDNLPYYVSPDFAKYLISEIEKNNN